jgi:hypothetical protein
VREDRAKADSLDEAAVLHLRRAAHAFLRGTEVDQDELFIGQSSPNLGD